MHRLRQSLRPMTQTNCAPIMLCIGVAFLSGCSYTNQFRDTPISKPHALLTADPADHWRDRGPTVSHINSQPTSFWRFSEGFVIPASDITLRVIADRPPYDFAPVRFTAAAGHHYHLRYEDSRSFVALHDIAVGGTGSTLITRTARERDKPQ